MTSFSFMSYSSGMFLLTCLLRGMTISPLLNHFYPAVSTHMPLARHDLKQCDQVKRHTEFLLTCLLRGMTVAGFAANITSGFLLTCLLRGMTRRIENMLGASIVSTHMPLARHDYFPRLSLCPFQFLLTCLLRGMTHSTLYIFVSFSVSTHMPLARHDRQIFGIVELHHRFYSHASCEAWPKSYKRIKSHSTFLLTCLLRGMTEKQFYKITDRKFLLTCLLRGMTIIGFLLILDYFQVSTHMPLARHDKNLCKEIDYDISFYSHASCEAWHNENIVNLGSLMSFYSHASCEAWLPSLRGAHRHDRFYSHASCEAWQDPKKGIPLWLWSFYSHASCEAWPKQHNTYTMYVKFLLTCLLRGMTKRT